MTGRLLRRFRGLPLRSRLALLTATAVAVAVAAVSAACWFVTRAQLESERDQSLQDFRLPERHLNDYVLSCASGSQDAPVPAGVRDTVQIVLTTGKSCSFGASPIPVRVADLAVARGDLGSALRTERAENGQEMRVHTYQAVIGQGTVGVQVARPTSEIDNSMATLAWVLLLVSGIGVIGAGAAGLWVARAGLTPVDRLTEAVEHVAATEDLTVRIPVEGEDEVARLSRSFNAMTAALASSRDRQAQLIADAGHELRTPLTSLRTNIELLARSEETGRALPPDDRRALMASVKAQMTELAALIGDLQELARPDAVAPGPLEVVALHEILRSALDRARLRGPELTFVTELAPWYVRAEPAGLERALVNVLDNAVKFSPPGGTVEVTLSDGGVLTVRDHGPGIPADELPHVFDRFWRSPSARSLPGSGLGLSIVARTVHQAGGTVTLAAAEGGGTAAVVRLPGAAAPPPSVVGDERGDQA
ncbi:MULTISPECIES: sensor histidine kinase [Streptomyces]|uniref:histidine kinase n=1 Tax=Streptomyces solicathayae TaxID=3081768 RepID=A0ABZ0LW17_9ACTN|nr:HAMP domain-containing sensor histidine kinase [Streptomyces sp. HUAS YS2]WOX23525.1 HAMP domain-containing sensor histidine kinase [Streptomyces sp. HUAS YS2]